jgi:PAS domain S-box-containing protein
MTSLSDIFANHEDLVRLLVETTLEGIWALDADGRTIFVNARTAGLLGYAQADIAGRFPADFMADETRADGQARLEGWRAGGAEQGECRWRRRDGSSLWTVVSAGPVRGPHGRSLGTLLMLTDISAHAPAMDALRERDELLDGIVQTSLDAIITVDDDQRIVQFNPAAAAIFRCAVDAAMG